MNARQRRRAIRAWRLRAELHAFGARLEVRDIPVDVLGQLMDYSLTLPTGAGPGRVWRQNVVQFLRHSYGYQEPRDRGRFAELLLPPSWLRASWVLATVLDEPDEHQTYPIRYERIRVLPPRVRVRFAMVDQARAVAR